MNEFLKKNRKCQSILYRRDGDRGYNFLLICMVAFNFVNLISEH